MRHARATAAVLVIAALAGCGTSVRATPSTPPRVPATATPTPVPATAAPTPTPDPALLEPATADGWRPVPADPLVAGTQWEHVVWTGDRFLAVGWDSMIGSDDGIRWTRVEPEPGATAGRVGMLADVVRVGGAIDGQDVTWESSDARTWRRLAAGADVPGPSTSAADRGWVRVGGVFTDEPCVGYCGPVAGSSAASTDSVTWTQSPAQDTLHDADLRAVVDWNGAWLAAGTRNSAIGLWSSADGLTWTRVKGATLRPWDRDAMAFAIGFARVGPTLVLAGFETTEESGSVRLWWSTDGRSWTDATVDGLGEYGQLNATWTDDSGVLATGWTSQCRAWSTSDGRTWRCIAGGGRVMDVSPWGIAESPTTQVLVGMSDEGWNEDSDVGPPGTIWWRPRP